MSKEYIEALKTVDNAIKKYSDMSFNLLEANAILSLEEALNRLEAIDNATPSEALECLERIDNTLCLNNIKGKLDFGIDDEEHTDCDSVIGMVEDLETIKQVLLKAQEPKQYLKWEDLEFKKKQQVMEVLLNGKPYILYFYKLATQTEVNMFAIDMHIVTLNSYYPEDVQFFNDLHLERVEE